jgi:hypothetical protein
MTPNANLYEALGRHPVHPFPARMAPGVALHVLANLGKRATVLDPMVGSGTVLALARAHGHRSIGYDLDPLAILISRVWTRTIDRREVRKCARRVLDRARRIAAKLCVRDSYPSGADEETKAFVRYWFDTYVRRQLTALSVAIAEVRAEAVREALWCAFSRQVIAKQAGVSLALDLAHSRPHRSFDRAPRKPFRFFLDAVDRVLDGCVHQYVKERGPAPNIQLGDVRAIPLADKSVDLVFTSPPYLNAIDYLRCSKFSLVWMGYSVSALRGIRAKSIGAEVGAEETEVVDQALKGFRLKGRLSGRNGRILNRYVEDSARGLQEIARVLAPGGRAVYVVGENTLRGTYIPTGRLIVRLATNAGLRLVERRSRRLPANRRYLPPPGAGNKSLDSRMRRETILTFEVSRRFQKRRTNTRTGPGERCM